MAALQVITSDHPHRNNTFLYVNGARCHLFFLLDSRVCFAIYIAIRKTAQAL